MGHRIVSGMFLRVLFRQEPLEMASSPLVSGWLGLTPESSFARVGALGCFLAVCRPSDGDSSQAGQEEAQEGAFSTGAALSGARVLSSSLGVNGSRPTVVLCTWQGSGNTVALNKFAS